MYKLLVVSNQKKFVAEAFDMFSDHFELLSSTPIVKDLEKHIEVCKPDALLYCIQKEMPSYYDAILNNRMYLKNADIPVAIFGSTNECSNCKAAIPMGLDVVLDSSDTQMHLVSELSRSLSRLVVDEESVTSATEEKIDDIPEMPSIPDLPDDIPQIEVDAPTAKGIDRLDSSQISSAIDDIISKRKPIEPEVVAATPVVAAVEPVQKKAPMYTPDGLSHILIVDDDVRMIKTIKSYLQDNYQVASAVSGSIALRYLESKPAQLILLDYEMPQMSGPEVLEKIRQNPVTKDIPVIFLTGASEREKIQKALEYKPRGYLLKPVQKDELITKIREVIG